jgi:hypothetical protein
LREIPLFNEFFLFEIVAETLDVNVAMS